jgi:outer membrane protein OmpA-like peptidoglycan-associated protein
LKLSNSKPGAVDSEVQIKLFDTNGKLLKVLTVSVTDETGSLQLELALPIGEFTVQASTVNAAGGSSQAVSQAAPVLQQSFFKPAVGNKPPVLAGTKVASPIGFPGNSSVLSASAKNALKKIAVKLKTAKGKIALTGFSAQVGSTSAFDKALSTKRAQAVANYLKSQGITIPIYFSGYGAVTNTQAAGVPRKVELRLIK